MINFTTLLVFGARYYTQIGPFRVDFGFPKMMVDFVFHIGIGASVLIILKALKISLFCTISLCLVVFLYLITSKDMTQKIFK